MNEWLELLMEQTDGACGVDFSELEKFLAEHKDEDGTSEAFKQWQREHFPCGACDAAWDCLSDGKYIESGGELGNG